MGNDERAKLRILLDYWIQHNKEHNQEFEEWREKAIIWGETEVSNDILAATRELDKASEFLSRALKRLEGKEP